MADYISQFTGGEIDRRLAKVSELEAGKQDKLVSGETIKTVGGQSLLGEGNIPLTDQEAVKFTPQTLTDAQKAQALANIGAASEDEVAALADQKYEGPYESAAALPTASASTMGAIYLVGPDGNGEYDRYVTKVDGSTYTWESLGKTSIDLSNYATKAEVGELEAEVNEKADQAELSQLRQEVDGLDNAVNGETTTVITELRSLISDSQTANGYGYTRSALYIKDDGSTGGASMSTLYCIFNTGNPISGQNLSCAGGRLWAAYSGTTLSSANYLSQYSDQSSGARTGMSMSETTFPDTVKMIVFACKSGETLPSVNEKRVISSPSNPGLLNRVAALEARFPSIIITKRNSSSFEVKVYSDAKQNYLTHTFIKMYDERDMEYGSGQTKHVVTCDCWYPDKILDENGNYLVQGNVNFIYNIKSNSGDFNGEGYYVGEGHGCAVSVFTKFFADGVEFDPTSLGNDELACETFRFVEKVNFYADNASLSASSRSYPKLDENGDVIIANVHFADALYERNNKITNLNRLTVKRDGTIFKSIFAGMSRVCLPYFSHLVLGDPDNSANGFSHNGTTWSFTDEGGAGIVLEDGTNHFLMGDNIIFYGDNYVYSQTIEQLSRPWAKLNLRNAIYNDTIKSVKVYQLPVIGSDAASTLGENAEEFMNGDVIACKLVRKIEYKTSSHN